MSEPTKCDYCGGEVYTLHICGDKMKIWRFALMWGVLAFGWSVLVYEVWVQMYGAYCCFAVFVLICEGVGQFFYDLEKLLQGMEDGGE